MDFVMSFWLAILTASVAVFLASWAMWMLLPHHKSDWKAFSNETDVVAAIRAGISGPGQYQFPFVDPKNMKDPELLKKCDEGPVGSVIVWKGNPMNMGKSLLLHFVHTVVLASLVCFFTFKVLGLGTQFSSVLKIAGYIAVLAYVGASVTQSIWFGRPWGAIFKEMVDGVVYALIMAAIFGWLWPYAA